jgi:hypothetical protein
LKVGSIFIYPLCDDTLTIDPRFFANHNGSELLAPLLGKPEGKLSQSRSFQTPDGMSKPLTPLLGKPEGKLSQSRSFQTPDGMSKPLAPLLGKPEGKLSQSRSFQTPDGNFNKSTTKNIQLQMFTSFFCSFFWLSFLMLSFVLYEHRLDAHVYAISCGERLPV